MIRRTAAITAASIAGVIIAGGAAVGANIGILNAADDNSLGQLSAEAPLTSSTTEPDVPAATIAPFETSSGSTQSFDVDTAGTVDLEIEGASVRLAAVRTNQGWSWADHTTDPGTVVVTFTSGSDTLEFIAVTNADGTISARVERPIVTGTQPQTTTGNTGQQYDDDDHDDDDHDDDDHDDDDHDDDDHDDDDHDDDDRDDDHEEHEGRDDDD